MKLNVSLSILNGTGVSAGVESSSDDFERMRLNESYSMSPQKACRNAAKKLRDAAARFDLLAKAKRDEIFKSPVHEAINNSKKVGKCKWWLDGMDCGAYETKCGTSFMLNEGTPYDNKMKFCPFCGREIYT